MSFFQLLLLLSSQKVVVAVRIIEKKIVWIVEDIVWPLLSSRNILPVLDVLTMEQQDVKLHFTPKLPKALR